MKILFVSLFLPRQKSYHAGGRYVFELLKNLSERHDISLATRLQEDETPYLDDLKPFCKAIYPYVYKTVSERGLLDYLGLMINYTGFSRFADRIIKEGNFDIVQVEWVEAGLMIKKRSAPMVLDAHDVMTKPAERAMLRSGGTGRFFGRLKYHIIRAVEKRIVKKFETIFTLSEYDRNYLLNMQPGLKVVTVPVPAGLDISEKKIDRKKNTILFLASYKYRKVNVDAALYFYRSVFPLIKKSVPDAKFIIAGYGPPEELTGLQTKDRSVLVPGFVEDIDTCYKEATVFVAPILTGGGIIVKVLDALAAGAPVVTTTYGNEGIGAVPGRDLLVADDPESFASAVVKLLKDPDLASEIGRKGHDFVRAGFSREAVIKTIEEAYEEMTVNRPPQAGPLAPASRRGDRDG